MACRSRGEYGVPGFSLPELAPRVVHVHAPDRAEDLSHVVTGTGVVPLAEAFGQLRSVEFSGFVSMEIGGPPERSSVEASTANVRRLWAEAE